jgi:hypothetical protein
VKEVVDKSLGMVRGEIVCVVMAFGHLLMIINRIALLYELSSLLFKETK